MTAYETQDSNATGLSLAKEVSLGVLSGGAVWIPREPNTYKSFGGSYKLIARQPINASRQSNKGVITDSDADGAWQEDTTYTNLQEIIEGVMFAAMRRKAELSVAIVDATSHAYQPASGGGAYTAGDLLYAKGFAAAANNGLKLVSGSPGAASIPSATGGLVTAAGNTGIISRVGFQFAADDLTATNNGGFLTLGATIKDLTTLGLIPGEWVFLGGDAGGAGFATDELFGYGRVGSISATQLVLDKFSGVSATDAGAGKSIQLFFGRLIKNESDPSLIVRTSYCAERTLGFEATDSAAQQAEYLYGSVINTLVETLNGADKATHDITLLSTQYKTTTSAEGLLPGTRPVLVSSGAFNTSTDLPTIRMTIAGQSAPLFARLTDMSLTINNNAKANKALGTLGAFSISTGLFEVSATLGAYFATVDAVAAIRNNNSVTLDAVLARDNTAIIWDLPLITLGDGAIKVAPNEPITLSLSVDAARASLLNPLTDYTLMIGFMDYVPNLGMNT